MKKIWNKLTTIILAGCAYLVIGITWLVLHFITFLSDAVETYKEMVREGEII